MSSQIPDLLTGTELCFVGVVPKAGGRWRQVHLNSDIVRQFFGVDPGSGQSITLERISAGGRVVDRTSRKFVYSEANKNWKLEFSFGANAKYPPPPDRPILVVVEAGRLTYRYRTVMPGEAGHAGLKSLLDAGPRIGRGMPRRIVTLDDVESYWPAAALRGGI